MIISRLKVNNLRTLVDVNIKLDEKLNIFAGSNGSGKTSILEAFNVLSNGRSFKSNTILPLINHSSKVLTVHGVGVLDGQTIRFGVTRDRGSSFKIRVNGEKVLQLSRLASLFPAFIVDPSFFSSFLSSRSSRLKVLNWIMFHVEPSFLTLWGRFQRLLKQRNELLKQFKFKKITSSELSFWDDELLDVSFKLSRLRAEFLSKLRPNFQKYSSQMFNDVALIDFQFKASVDKLDGSFRESDKVLGYTQDGPHKDDLVFMYDNHVAQDSASNGQKKLLVSSFVLSAINAVCVTQNKRCFVAFDDLPAELDKLSQERLIAVLMGLENVQLALTSVTIDSLPASVSGYNKQVFHVEHGQFQVQ